MASDIDTPEDIPGASRRTFLRRSAVVGGTLLWAAPTVQMLDLSARAAASTSGHQCVCSPPSCFFFICRIRLTPHGCDSRWGNGQYMGFQWTPGSGFSAPGGSNNPLRYSGVNNYDASSQFYQEVVQALNKYSMLADVSQTTVRLGHVDVPSYTLKLSSLFFGPVGSNGQSYCGFSLTSGGTSFCSYDHNSPWGWDTYCFQGYSYCSTPHH